MRSVCPSGVFEHVRVCVSAHVHARTRARGRGGARGGVGQAFFVLILRFGLYFTINFGHAHDCSAPPVKGFIRDPSLTIGAEVMASVGGNGQVKKTGLESHGKVVEPAKPRVSAASS